MNISAYAIPGIAVRKVYKADQIIKAVCSHFGTSPDYLKSKTRHMDAVMPRHIAMYLIRKNTPYALINIGKIFYRDHTTVINALQQINNYYFTKNDAVINAIESISLNIKNDESK